MRLLTYSRYGTRMVLEIAVRGRSGPVQMSEIAKHQDISQKYLEKIIRILKRAGIIVSVRGPKGGHLLARPAEQVTVGEVVRVLEGDTFLVDCLACPDVCDNAPDCLTRAIWREGSEAMFRKFDQITFAELIRYAEQGIKFGDLCPSSNALGLHASETEDKLRLPCQPSRIKQQSPWLFQNEHTKKYSS